MQKIFLLFLFLAVNTAATAQPGYGGYGGRGGRNANYNGGMMQQQQRNNGPSKKEIEKSKEEAVDKTLERLKKELNLDELQVIVIRKIVEDDQKSRGAIIANKEISDEEKVKEITSLTERTNFQITSYLKPDQKEKYDLIKK